MYPLLGFGALEDVSPFLSLIRARYSSLYFPTFSGPYKGVFQKYGPQNSKCFPSYIPVYIYIYIKIHHIHVVLGWESRILTHHTHQSPACHLSLPTSLQCPAQLNLHPCSCDGCPGPPALTSLFAGKGQPFPIHLYMIIYRYILYIYIMYIRCIYIFSFLFVHSYSLMYFPLHQLASPELHQLASPELHQLASRHHPVKHPGSSTTTNQGAKPRCEKPVLPSITPSNDAIGFTRIVLGSF